MAGRLSWRRHVGGDIVRCVAMSLPMGLSGGRSDTGRPITVP